MAIFTALILPIHEHRNSFHLLSLLWFLSSETWHSCHIDLSLVWLVTPRYFILFVTIVRGVVSLITFSAYLSFAYKKATDFFEYILYTATLLKLLISCRSSLVEFFGSLKYTIISSADSDSLTSSFPICIPLTTFCNLIALARTPSTILMERAALSSPWF